MGQAPKLAATAPKNCPKVIMQNASTRSHMIMRNRAIKVSLNPALLRAIPSNINYMVRSNQIRYINTSNIQVLTLKNKPELVKNIILSWS